MSFESVDWPGYYLTAPAPAAQNGGAVQLVQNDGSTALAGRATFAAVTGLTGQNTSFQSWGNKNLYLRHDNFQLFVQPQDASDVGRADSTFAVPLSVGRSIGLEAANFPGQRLQHANYLA